MSKLFYDHLIDLPDLEGIIKANTTSAEEREEYMRLVDEIIHHKVLGCIFEYLPSGYHEEFAKRLEKSAHHDSLLTYLKEKILGDIESIIKDEVDKAASEIIQGLKT